METVADVFRLGSGDRRPALCFEDDRWSYDELAAACARRAHYLLADRQPGPFHIGVLLDNVPEFVFWIGACALAGATLVALNPTRRGTDLARDVAHADCQMVVTERRHRDALEAVKTVPQERIHDVDDGRCAALIEDFEARAPEAAVAPRDRFLLMFTSGTGGAPKAVIYSHERVMRNGRMLLERQGINENDVFYAAMPLFHSSGLLMGLLPPLMARGQVALRRRFSASGFLPDVRRYGVTRFCYVGKPLAYILATPERADDADNPLRSAFGSEAADVDIAAFSQRFGCQVFDSYGSSEGCITILRTPETPRGSLGVGVAPSIRVMNPETGLECSRARFDAHGVLLNGGEAIGEIVNLEGGALFEGYWNNTEAQSRRIRDGAYWSGDLGYRDEHGFFYFAGRDSEWLRVDGENLSVIQIEQVLVRHPA
ncbi:MAG TPA: AMP-binding protein, partial [Steroidobacter sp.]|nr:AMP-binding protein [Steroidobacter sp.]